MTNNKMIDLDLPLSCVGYHSTSLNKVSLKIALVSHIYAKLFCFPPYFGQK